MRLAALLIALGVILTASPARANFVGQDYEDWAYYQTTGWWLNCQAMATGPAGYSISLKSQIDTQSGAADSEFFLYSKQLSGITAGRESLDVLIVFDGGETREVTLSVARPTKARLEIGADWPLIADFLWRGEAVLYAVPGRRIDSFSLQGAQAAIGRWQACLSDNSR